MRFKKRYLLYELLPGHHQFQYHQIRSVLVNAIQEAHGDYGTAVLCHSLRVHTYNKETNMVIIRSRFGQHHLVQSAMCFIKQIASQNVSFRALHVGGTIKSTERFLIKHQRKSLPPLLALCKNKEERQKIQTSIRESCRKMTKHNSTPRRGGGGLINPEEIKDEDEDNI